MRWHGGRTCGEPGGAARRSLGHVAAAGGGVRARALMLPDALMLTLPYNPPPRQRAAPACLAGRAACRAARGRRATSRRPARLCSTPPRRSHPWCSPSAACPCAAARPRVRQRRLDRAAWRLRGRPVRPGEPGQLGRGSQVCLSVTCPVLQTEPVQLHQVKVAAGAPACVQALPCTHRWLAPAGLARVGPAHLTTSGSRQRLPPEARCAMVARRMTDVMPNGPTPRSVQ